MRKMLLKYKYTFEILFMILAMLLMMAISSPAKGQSLGGGLFGPTRAVRAGASDPATCNPTVSNIFLNTTTDLLKVCTAANTWTPLLLGSGGTLTGEVGIRSGATSDIVLGNGTTVQGIRMRSDWSLQWSGSENGGGTPDTILSRDAANTLALRNGTNAQAFNIYNTTDGTNKEYAFNGWSGNVYYLSTAKTGSTGTARDMVFQRGSVDFLRLDSSDAVKFYKPISFDSDNARDIGSSTAAAKSAYIKTSIQGTASKTLADAVATEFVEISVASNSFVGGRIEYTITATDNTEYQARSGSIPFVAVNKGGTETASIDAADADEVVAVSAGTMTNAFTINTTPTNGVRILANANTSLAATSPIIQYRVIITSGTATVTGL